MISLSCAALLYLFGVSFSTAKHTLSKPDQSFPIKNGYVAFGDSFAAGIGTGITETDGCRKGEYSYPRQLKTLAGDDIDFQNLPCSTSVLEEVLQGGSKSQIDDWKDPANADIATFSIGGNDIGFYPILTSCVLHVNEWFEGDCDAAISRAHKRINDGDIFNGTVTALHQMIAKSGRDDFKVYQTGYPTSFNTETESCNNSTFDFWNPGHHDIRKEGDWAYLNKDLRRRLNDVVIHLNKMLSLVADRVNSQYSTQRVWFVDPNSKFEGHRFCETDDGAEVVEPAADRTDTWFFLSGWKDSYFPDTTYAGGIKKRDFADALQIEQEQEVLKGYLNGDDDVPWYIATRSAKTFHPRSLGHQAYTLALLELWAEEASAN